MPFYLGAFLAVALDWRAQARNAALHTQALQALETRVATLEEEKKALGRQNKTYQACLKLVQEAKEEAEKQLGEAMELQADFYAREVTLQVQITGLQGMVEAFEEVQKDLKNWSGWRGRWLLRPRLWAFSKLTTTNCRCQPAPCGEGGSGETGSFWGRHHRGVGEGQKDPYRRHGGHLRGGVQRGSGPGRL